VNRHRFAGLLASCLLIAGCQWRLPSPRLADVVADAPSDASDGAAIDTLADATDDRAADATEDAAIPSFAFPNACRDAPSRPTSDPRAPLEHVASIQREMREFFDSGRGVCVGDLDGDGRVEVLVPDSNGVLAVRDAATLCLRAEIAVPTLVRSCIVADLDGDRRADLALVRNERWGARLADGQAVVVGRVEAHRTDAGESEYRFSSPENWRSPMMESRNIRGIGTVLAVLDLDGNGRRELVVGGTMTVESPYSDAFVRGWEWRPCGLGMCPQEVVNHTFRALDVQTLLVASLDDDPEDELFVELGCGRGGIFRFDRAWTIPKEVGVIGDTSNGNFGDLDGDGTLDFITAVSPLCNDGLGRDAALRWLRYDAGRLLYYTEQSNPRASRGLHTFAVPMDAMGDRRPEVFLCSRSRDPRQTDRVRCDLFYVDTPYLDAEWTWVDPDEPIQDLLSTVLVFDGNADGRQDALVVGARRLHLFLGRPR
jgi:hypothetical protein